MEANFDNSPLFIKLTQGLLIKFFFSLNLSKFGHQFSRTQKARTSRETV